MGKTTFVLSLTLGDYEDRTTRVLAVSNDRSKLETYRDEDIAKKKFYVKVLEECNSEFDKAIEANPFATPEPPARLPKPTVAPRTKEEHEARAAAKDECSRIHNEWHEANGDHEQAVWKKVAKEVFTKNKHPGKIPDTVQPWIDYDIKTISETNYDIFEVREL